MDRSDVIELIGSTHTQDAYGVQKREETHREVFCQVQSVSRQEFFSAGAQGLRPALVFVMFEPDYKGEEIVDYNGVRYTIYRSYIRRDDMIELYAEKRQGNGKKED